MERINELKKEVLYKTSRSGGKGGQNVNKVSTKVELIFNVDSSAILNQDEKNVIREKLNVDNHGYLHFVSDWSRSQLMNKKDVTDRFEKIIKEALKKKKQRRETKPTKASKEKRMIAKKSISEKKYLRKKDFYED